MNKRIIVPNKLGWVTSLSINSDFQLNDITNFSDSTRGFMTAENPIIDVDLSLRIANVRGVRQVLSEWLGKGEIHAPTFVTEWMCLYCKSPNSIGNRHCESCGAARNFILG